MIQNTTRKEAQGFVAKMLEQAKEPATKPKANNTSHFVSVPDMSDIMTEIQKGRWPTKKA